jgi:UDP-N-acetylmuramoylalanine-D-glutamate ligase
MEKIAKYNNITFIDDGISTTPESTIEAIKTF